jgi:hypothetical protein
MDGLLLTYKGHRVDDDLAQFSIADFGAIGVCGGDTCIQEGASQNGRVNFVFYWHG